MSSPQSRPLRRAVGGGVWVEGREDQHEKEQDLFVLSKNVMTHQEVLAGQLEGGEGP